MDPDEVATWLAFFELKAEWEREAIEEARLKAERERERQSTKPRRGR